VSSGDEPKGEEKRGFGGLAGMVSSIESTEPASSPSGKTFSTESASGFPAETATRGKGPATATTGSSGPQQQSAQQVRPSSARKWVIGIAALLGVAWIVVLSVGREPSKKRVPPSSAGPTRQVAPQPKALDETKPPPGTNAVLTRLQLRYCLAENIRLGAARRAVNTYSDSEASRYNAMVDDFNIRCGQYRHGEGELKTARADVEEHRSELEKQGQSRFDGTFDGATTRPGKDSDNADFDWGEYFGPLPEGEASQHLEPSLTIRTIQHVLKSMGYQIGPADGLMGARTKAALVAFQQDSGLELEGATDEAILEILVKAVSQTGRESATDQETAVRRRQQADQTSQPLRVGGQVTTPVRLSGPMPQYTDSAREAGIEGSVVFEAVVRRDGSVSILRTQKGLPNGLLKAAWDSVQQWRFSPGTLNGQPVDVYYTLTVNFELK